jgi:CTP synthase (UTP-ammonia lyase)
MSDVGQALRIAIAGDFNPRFHSHLATNAAIQHAAAALGIGAIAEWVPTPSAAETVLERYDAVWMSPGSPYARMEGALRSIEFARRRDWPYTGS